MRRLLFLVLLLSGAVEAQEYDSTQIPVERVVDFHTLDLELELQPKKKRVRGTAAYTFSPLRASVDSMYLHARDLEIESVVMDGVELRFRQDEEGVHVFPHPPVKGESQMTITYEAFPKKGMYFNGWDGNGRKQIWTQGQGIKNRHWVPCFDLQHDKVVTSIALEFDKDFEVISNGALAVKEERGRKTYWKYAMNRPQSTYLMALIIGEYDVMRQRSPFGTPVENYFYPDLPEHAEPTFVETNQLLSYLEEEIGVAYPWSAYRQAPVEYFLYGAMENTTAVVLNDRYMVDWRSRIDENYVYVNAHEMAHHWFGDWLTARTGHDHWLQEGFATYYGALGERAMLGDEVADYRRWRDYGLVTTRESSNAYPLQHNAAGSLIHYQKGRLVLDMLREEVGDVVFRRVISQYVIENGYGLVDSKELLNYFSDVAGRSLGWFWDQWIYEAGVPTLRVDVDTTRSEEQTVYGFTLNQYQESEPFRFGWNWEIVLEGGGRLSGREFVQYRQHRWTVSLPEGQKIAYILYDPDGIVLKQFVHPYTMEELLAISQDTAHYFSRAQALKELSRFPGLAPAEDWLAAMPLDDDLRKLWARNFIYYPEEAVEVGSQWLQSSREELYETAWYLGQGDPSLIDSTLISELWKTGSPVFLEALLDDLMERDAARFAYLLQDTYSGNNGNNLEVRRAMWKYALDGEDQSLKYLLRFGSEAYNRQTRENAWRALRTVECKDVRWREQLEAASEHYNYRFRTAAKRYLQYLQEVN